MSLDIIKQVNNLLLVALNFGSRLLILSQILLILLLLGLSGSLRALSDKIVAS